MEAANYGIITLLPALVVVVFAVWTRKTWEMLLLGGLISCIIAYGFGFVTPFIDLICEAVSDGDTMWIVLISLLFGSVIRLLRESKSTQAFATIAEKLATTPKKSLMITWIIGLIIFIDDYLSIMTTANAMIDTTDKKKVPREMLAYVLDSTSAPVCVIIPISAWVVYFSGVFSRQPEAEYLGDGMAAYYASIPWVFYAWICVLIVPLVILGVIPRIGAMKKAWERTETTGQTYSDYSKKFNELIVSEDQRAVGVQYFLIPLAVIVFVTVMVGDILYGVMAGIVACAVMYIPGKVMTFDKISECIIKGMEDMVWMAAIIVSGHVLREGVLLIGMPDYVVTTVAPYMSPVLLPVLSFIVISALAFVTSSVWSIPAVITPIVVPLAAAIGVSIPLTFGTILSGAIFGAHACFYADVTVLSSAAARIDNMDHCLSQLPYALIGAGVACIGYLIAGFAMV